MRNVKKLLSKNIKGRDHLEHLEVDGKITLEWNGGKVWAGFIRFRIGTCSELLWTR